METPGESSHAPSAETFVTFPCGMCGISVRATASEAGRLAKCATCGASVTVPAPPRSPHPARGDGVFMSAMLALNYLVVFGLIALPLAAVFALLGLIVLGLIAFMLPPPKRAIGPFDEVTYALLLSCGFGVIMGLSTGFLLAGRVCRLMDLGKEPGATGAGSLPPPPPT